VDLLSFAPKKFIGNFNEDAEDWIFRFNLYVKAVNISQPDIVLIIPLFLEEDALIWYKNVEENIKQDKDLLFEKFIKKYGKTRIEKINLTVKFMDREQREDESVFGLINDIRRLANQAKLPADFILNKLKWSTRTSSAVEQMNVLDMDKQEKVEEKLKIAERCRQRERNDLTKLKETVKNTEKQIKEIMDSQIQIQNVQRKIYQETTEHLVLDVVSATIYLHNVAVSELNVRNARK